MNSTNHFYLSERQFFTSDRNSTDGILLPEAVFAPLERLSRERRIPDSSGRMHHILTPDGSGAKRILRHADCVGVIVLRSGFHVELFRSSADDAASARRELLRQLRSRGTLPQSTVSPRHAPEETNLFELFIRLFLDEVSLITRNSLKRAYLPRTANENFLKGKVIYAQHATKNFAHKDRFYVQYDVYSVDRPENRLLRSTLKYLRSLSVSAENLRRINALLPLFDEASDSLNFRQDLAACSVDRSMHGYAEALAWVKLFLLSKDLSVITGREIAYAALLPS